MVWRYLTVIGTVCVLMGCAKPHERAESSTALTPFLKPCDNVPDDKDRYPIPSSECGALQVLEDPDNNQSPRISIHVVRLPAFDKSRNLEPLVLIAGGPGGSSIDMAYGLHGVFHHVQKERDLIFIDQRGTGKSSPRHCDIALEDDHTLSDDEVLFGYNTQLARCAERFSSTVLLYTTPMAVKDFDAVREALGYGTWNIWGVSYGTRVALEYARQYPATTRALVLDGVAPISITLPRYFSRDAQHALTQASEACNADTQCQSHYGDVVEKAKVVTERLTSLAEQQQSPRVTVKHPVNQQSISMTMTAGRFSRVIHTALYSRDAMTLLPILIANAYAEQYELIATTLLFFDHQQKNSMAEAMHFSVICNEDYQLLKQQSRSDSVSFLGRDFASEYHELCPAWDNGGVADTYFQPTVSDVPTLLLSGAFDPVTPPVWAKAASETLTTAWHVTVNGGNHSVSAEGCMPLAINYFLQNLELDNTPECTYAIKTMPLFLGAKTASLVKEVDTND
jgi:pimeloyl-ACP methyl ester carboxylesterase